MNIKNLKVYISKMKKSVLEYTSPFLASIIMNGEKWKQNKKWKLRRGLPLGLVAIGLVSVLSGCDGDYVQEVPVDEMASKYVKEIEEQRVTSIEVVENSIDIAEFLNKKETTQDYFLVSMDGENYLTKRIGSQNEENVIYSYYDVKTGQFVGQQVEIAWYNRGYLRAQEKRENGLDSTVPLMAGFIDASIENQKHDTLYYDGEYGYGKNLPSFAITPLSDFISSDIPTQEEFDFFSSNSPELKMYLEENQVYNEVKMKVKDNYRFEYNCKVIRLEYYYQNYPSFYTHNEVYQYINPLKISYTDIEGKDRLIIGYRCSYHEQDNGYKIIYDLITNQTFSIDEILQNSKNVTTKAYDMPNTTKKFLTVEMGESFYLKYYDSAYGGLSTSEGKGYVQEVEKDGITYLVDKADYSSVLLSDYSSLGDAFYLKYYDGAYGGCDSGRGSGYVQEVIREDSKDLVDANDFHIVLADYDSLGDAFYLKYYDGAYGGSDNGRGSGYVQEVIKDGIKYLVDANDFTKILVSDYQSVTFSSDGNIIVEFADGTSNSYYKDFFAATEDDYLVKKYSK